ncbi:sodium-dependent serotonin transporter-like isoform X2 [Octopus sinensis]|nr:sodium-dependent serotonin transporter-like isoform X2 [Octopus sinensis]XP_036359792.1 sodium-dependent serotonin transporter-like isoform X2 [Octopus sinensis]
MTPSPTVPVPVGDGTMKIIERPKDEEERETWGKKLDFLLSVIGFAVDLGNVWRFPYICYRNGGGAFLIPYIIMLVFGGLPLFYMELALGQYQRCGCFTVWNRICPMFKGIGLSIFVISTYVAFYYNTIIAWSVYYLFSSFNYEVPWLSCNNSWNSDNCTTFEQRRNQSLPMNLSTSSAQEFFENNILEIQYSKGIDDVGGVKWKIFLCLLGVFSIVYFSLWKGIKSSGKVVWVTATLPYIVLLVLLVRGCTLPGSYEGIIYYLKPNWSMLLQPGVWIDAAAQIFFSLGPGFGVLLALSSYNKFNNNCYKDALITSAVNCCTSFFAGFAVFSVLGYMAHVHKKSVADVSREDVGLIFIVYPEAIATLKGSVFWAIIFFVMLTTLGLDTTFGGLEAICTGILDEFPKLRRHRELFVAFLLVYCLLGGLATTTYGGIYVVQLLDTYGAPISILFVVFLESVAVSWIYGVNRFSDDIESMIGTRPGIFWRGCWAVVSPVFLLMLFTLSVVSDSGPVYGNYQYPSWSIGIGWIIVCSSLICIPLYIIYKFFTLEGSVCERLRKMIQPSELPKHVHRQEAEPIFL